MHFTSGGDTLAGTRFLLASYSEMECRCCLPTNVLGILKGAVQGQCRLFVMEACSISVGYLTHMQVLYFQVTEARKMVREIK